MANSMNINTTIKSTPNGLDAMDSTTLSTITTSSITTPSIHDTIQNSADIEQTNSTKCEQSKEIITNSINSMIRLRITYHYSI